MTAANCPFGKWQTIFQLGRLIKSNNKIENRKITFSYKTISFQPKKLEKDQFLIKFKFGRKFKLYTIGHSLSVYIFIIYNVHTPIYNE